MIDIFQSVVELCFSTTKQQFDYDSGSGTVVLNDQSVIIAASNNEYS